MHIISKLDTPEGKTEAKFELVQMVQKLMPAGRPDFLGMIQYPKVSDLITQHGGKKMLLLLSAMIRDFCASVNVARSMNADQIVEAAAMLMDECGNFRLEDYTMMFSMAKRGQLVKIYERVDLSVITEMLDLYWQKRRDAAQQAQDDEINTLEGLGPSNKNSEAVNPQDRQLQRGADNFAGALNDLKNKWNASKK